VESAMGYESDIVVRENCAKCKVCVKVCPALLKDMALAETLPRLGCISCGECLRACPCNAVSYRDDTIQFMQDLHKGEKITLLVAPAALKHFSSPERLFGLLKGWGVSSIHNVLLYADITIWAYVELLRKNPGFGYIASPCAAIIRYIQCHKPRLRRQIMPVYSPLHCAALYLRRYEKIKTKFAFLSPCIAKRSEIHVVGQSMISHNVTIGSLKEYLQAHFVDLEQHPLSAFDDFKARSGTTLALYGGISESIVPHIPGLRHLRISGANKAYEFLDNYEKVVCQKNSLPDLVEIFNCENPCDGGPGCGQNLSGFSYQRKPSNGQSIIDPDRYAYYASAAFARFRKELKIGDFMAEF